MGNDGAVTWSVLGLRSSSFAHCSRLAPPSAKWKRSTLRTIRTYRMMHGDYTSWSGRRPSLTTLITSLAQVSDNQLWPYLDRVSYGRRPSLTTLITSLAQVSDNQLWAYLDRVSYGRRPSLTTLITSLAQVSDNQLWPYLDRVSYGRRPSLTTLITSLAQVSAQPTVSLPR